MDCGVGVGASSVGVSGTRMILPVYGQRTLVPGGRFKVLIFPAVGA